MSRTIKHHHELTNGKGKCSVPMYMGGCPAGFCDRPAYGEYVDTVERYPQGPYRGQRMDNKFDGYVPGLACTLHGGPHCQGFEIEEGTGDYSGCNAHVTGATDCPVCGEEKTDE